MQVVILQLDGEKERVLKESLNLYKQMIEKSLGDSSSQRTIADYEKRLANQMLTQIQRVHDRCAMLPTIAAQPQTMDDWEQQLEEIKQGKVGSISGIAKGMLWRITYDHRDQLYRLLEDNQVILQTQHASIIERRLRMLNRGGNR